MGTFNMGPGAQMMIDAILDMAGTGLPVYYRVLNFTPTPNDEAEQLGFERTVTTPDAGTTDILVTPQPRVKNLSMRDIAASNGKLNESSRYFVISDSFVQQILGMYPEITDHELVFDGFSKFVGLVYEGVLYDVAKYAHSEITGSTVSWRLTCNATK